MSVSRRNLIGASAVGLAQLACGGNKTNNGFSMTQAYPNDNQDRPLEKDAAVVKISYEYDRNAACHKLPSEVGAAVHYNSTDFEQIRASLGSDGHLTLNIKGRRDKQIVLRMFNLDPTAPELKIKLDLHALAEYPLNLPEDRRDDLKGSLFVRVKEVGHHLNFDLSPKTECPGGLRFHTVWHIGC